MESLENHGLIIRELRTNLQLSIHKAAGLIEKSAGWLCEIENGKRRSRLSSNEFNRIVEILGGSNQKHLFKTWVASQKNLERNSKIFDGAVLKFIRLKKEFSLSNASKMVEISKGYLSKLETGKAPLTFERRNQIMRAYGYSPSSFKNLATDPVRSKAVPSRFKFQIILQKISSAEAESLFATLIENF